MKVLAIDAGNSRIKWGLHDGARWQLRSWVDTARAGDLRAGLAEVAVPDAIAIANVAGDAVARAIVAAVADCAAAPIWLKSGAAQCGVRSSYDDPEQLGPDRWAALIGAWHRFGRAAVVVNAGTAVTVDALTADAVFVGGAILPGLRLMREALARNTAGLPLAAGEFSYFPANTADAIASGAIDAVCGAIERMARFLEEAGHAEPLTALSGGTAGLLVPHLTGPVEVVDNLVLEGLLRVANDPAAAGRLPDNQR